MSRKKINRGLLLGFLAYGTDAVVSTLLFPLLIKHLGKAEAGVWMLYNSLGALFACVLSGTAPVVARATAGALGQMAGSESFPLAWVRLQALKLYRHVVLIIGLVALVIAFAYLPKVAIDNGLPTGGVVVCWGVFMAGWIARAFAGLYFSHLDGAGEIGYNRALGTGAGILNIIALYCILPTGLGLLGPTVVYVVAAGLLLWSAAFLCRQRMPASFWGVPSSGEPPRLLGDSLKMLVLSFTSYVTTQSCIVLVERTEGAAMLATFAPVVRLTVMIAGAASLPATMLFPYLSRLHAEGAHGRYKKLCLAVMFVPPALYALPGTVLLCFPERVIGLWLGEDNYIGDATVRLVVIYGFLFTLHSAFATPAVAIRARTFVKESVLNMVLVALFMPLLAAFMGVAGYPAGMLAGTIIPSVLVLVQSVKVMRNSCMPASLEVKIS